MRNVRNSVGKTVCKIDVQDKLVEILHKGAKTQIKFLPNGRVEIINIGSRKIKK